MSISTHKETGWPTVCNVVSSINGDTVLIPSAAGQSVIIVGAIVLNVHAEVTLRANNSSGTIITYINANSGLLPGRIVVPEGDDVYLDGPVACTLWYYIETL